MPVFEFQTGGKTYEFNAPDPDSALAAFKQVAMPQTTGNMVPSFDAMGAPTGMQEQQLASPQMPYGEQMANVGQAVDTGVRQIAKGVPVIGSYLDEANAATRSALGQGSYDENLAAERARDRQFETQNPGLSTAMQIGGGLASGGALLKAAPGVGNFILGNGGVSLPGRMAVGAMAGAGTGGVYGFGQGEGGFDNRLNEAASGAGVGAGVGFALPGVTGIGSKMADALRNWGVSRGVANELGVPRGAVTRVSESLRRDELTPQIAAQRAADMGPDGMVLDMGRQLAGRAEAVATMPGTGANKVLDAVEQRVKTTSERMGADLDRELGQNPDVVQLAKRIEDHFKPIVQPAYEQVMTAHPKVWNEALQKLTRRPSIRRAVEDAVDLAKESGDDIVSPFVKNADGSLSLKEGETPNLKFWDTVKKSLDSRIGVFQRNPDPDSAGKLSGAALLDTKRALVDHLDDLTKGEYKRARKLAADQITTRNSLQDGLEFFNNKLLPEQFKEALDDLGPLQIHAMRAGVRRAFGKLSDTSNANLSDGGRRMFREVLRGGENGDTAQKLRLLLGDDQANSLISAAKRETGFQENYSRIATNSRTAPRQAAQADMEPMQAPETFTSAINKAAAAPLSWPINSVLKQGNERVREGVADLLTRQGAERDRALNALMRVRGASNNATRDKLVALLMAPASGSQADAIADKAALVKRVFGGQR